jgi:hypothetical protein
VPGPFVRGPLVRRNAGLYVVLTEIAKTALEKKRALCWQLRPTVGERSALRLSCARARTTLELPHVRPPDTATIPRASTYPPPPPPRIPPPRAAYTGRNRNRRSGPGPAAANGNAGGALISENNRTRTRTRARALFAPPPAPLTPDRPPAPPPPYSNGVWCSLPGGVTSAADQWRDAELAYNRHIWDAEGAVEAEVGAMRVLHEVLQGGIGTSGKFINCEG